MILVGIYSFQNKINGKMYLGQSINIMERKSSHKCRYKLKDDSGFRSAIHSAFRKYGFDNFDFKIVEQCSAEELDEKEKYWIKYYNSMVPNGYNILSGGQRNRDRKIKVCYCPICQKPISKGASLCRECSQKNRSKSVERASILKKEEINLALVDKILSTNFESVARDYGYTSGNAIKKRLVSAGFPSKKEKLEKWYYEQTGVQHNSVLQRQEKAMIKMKNKQKFTPRPVNQLTLDGVLVRRYDSMSSAIKDGFRSGHISECCRGKRKTVKGYRWEYADLE